jgi:hypothetical protein
MNTAGRHEVDYPMSSRIRASGKPASFTSYSNPQPPEPIFTVFSIFKFYAEKSSQLQAAIFTADTIVRPAAKKTLEILKNASRDKATTS